MDWNTSRDASSRWCTPSGGTPAHAISPCGSWYWSKPALSPDQSSTFSLLVEGLASLVDLPIPAGPFHASLLKALLLWEANGSTTFSPAASVENVKPGRNLTRTLSVRRSDYPLPTSLRASSTLARATEWNTAHRRGGSPRAAQWNLACKALSLSKRRDDAATALQAAARGCLARRFSKRHDDAALVALREVVASDAQVTAYVIPVVISSAQVAGEAFVSTAFAAHSTAARGKKKSNADKNVLKGSMAFAASMRRRNRTPRGLSRFACSFNCAFVNGC